MPSSSTDRPGVEPGGVSPLVPHPGMRIGDRYRLKRSLGRGGIGEVWEAEQAPTDRRVAVKMLLPVWQTDRDVRKRFMREGRLASNMHHRHIVDVLEVGETREGLPFIAMELVQGDPLHRVVERDGPLPWERVKRILLQVCGALDHAHGLKIIHRDVKPSNVMLIDAPHRPDRCKLVDFGIAKQVLVNLHTQPLTAEGQMLGSPGFTSPEQLQGQPTDPRADVYGLGCTGYYLLTGQIPYRGRTAAEMLHNALYERPRTLELELDEELRADIETVLHRAVHRDLSQRYRSVLDLVVAINNIGRGDGHGPAARARIVVSAVGRPPGPLPDTVVEGRLPDPEEASLLDDVVTPVVTPASGPRGVISTKGYSPILAGRGGIDRVSWGAPEGFVELARMPPDVIVVHMRREIGSSAKWLFDTQLGSLITRNRPAHLFWNLDEIQSYPADVRDATLRCLSEHRDEIASIHVLKGPGRAGIAVSVAMVALGNQTRMYEDAAKWMATLERWSHGERDE